MCGVGASGHGTASGEEAQDQAWSLPWGLGMSDEGVRKGVTVAVMRREYEGEMVGVEATTLQEWMLREEGGKQLRKLRSVRHSAQ